jgi:hypothetical protein
MPSQRAHPQARRSLCGVSEIRAIRLGGASDKPVDFTGCPTKWKLGARWCVLIEYPGQDRAACVIHRCYRYSTALLLAAALNINEWVTYQ